MKYYIYGKEGDTFMTSCKQSQIENTLSEEFEANSWAEANLYYYKTLGIDPPKDYSFLAKLYAEKNTDRGIDLIFDHFDRLFTDGNFGEADDILFAVEIDKLTPDLLISFLTAGNWAKSKLKELDRYRLSIRRRFVKEFGEEKTNRLLGRFS